MPLVSFIVRRSTSTSTTVKLFWPLELVISTLMTTSQSIRDKGLPTYRFHYKWPKKRIFLPRRAAAKRIWEWNNRGVFVRSTVTRFLSESAIQERSGSSEANACESDTPTNRMHGKPVTTGHANYIPVEGCSPGCSLTDRRMHFAYVEWLNIL